MLAHTVTTTNSSSGPGVLRRACAVVLALLIFCEATLAQTGVPTNLGDWKNVENLAPGTDIWIKLKTGEKMTATFENATAERIDIYVSRRNFPGRVYIHTQLPRERIREIRISKRLASQLVAGAIGAGIGAGLGLAVEHGRTSEDGHLVTFLTTFLFGAIGAGIGRVNPFLKGMKIYVAPDVQCAPCSSTAEPAPPAPKPSGCC